MRAPCNSKEAPLADGEGGRNRTGGVGGKGLECADVPYLYGVVDTAGGEIVATVVDGDTFDGTSVTDHFYEGLGHVGTPHCNASFGMT